MYSSACRTFSGKCKEHKTTSFETEVHDIYGTYNKSPADAETIEVLAAISHVSARLARKLTVLAAHSKSEIKNNMRKMNDMSMTIEELCNATAAINDAAN